MVWYLVVLTLYFSPDGPTTTRLGKESEDGMLYSFALCQERLRVLSQLDIPVTMNERQDSTTSDQGIRVEIKGFPLERQVSSDFLCLLYAHKNTDQL